jgi:hypothetical protein
MLECTEVWVQDISLIWQTDASISKGDRCSYIVSTHAEKEKGQSEFAYSLFYWFSEDRIMTIFFQWHSFLKNIFALTFWKKERRRECYREYLTNWVLLGGGDCEDGSSRQPKSKVDVVARVHNPNYGGAKVKGSTVSYYPEQEANPYLQKVA